VEIDESINFQNVLGFNFSAMRFSLNKSQFWVAMAFSLNYVLPTVCVLIWEVWVFLMEWKLFRC